VLYRRAKTDKPVFPGFFAFQSVRVSVLFEESFARGGKCPAVAYHAIMSRKLNLADEPAWQLFRDYQSFRNRRPNRTPPDPLEGAGKVFAGSFVGRGRCAAGSQLRPVGEG
jgi:hypothetical protein